MKVYEKPVVSVDAGMAEGVYALKVELAMKSYEGDISFCYRCRIYFIIHITD